MAALGSSPTPKARRVRFLAPVQLAFTKYACPVVFLARIVRVSLLIAVRPNAEIPAEPSVLSVRFCASSRLAPVRYKNSPGVERTNSAPEIYPGIIHARTPQVVVQTDPFFRERRGACSQSGLYDPIENSCGQIHARKVRTG